MKRYTSPSRRTFLKTLAGAGVASQFGGLFRDVWAAVPDNAPRFVVLNRLGSGGASLPTCACGNSIVCFALIHDTACSENAECEMRSQIIQSIAAIAVSSPSSSPPAASPCTSPPLSAAPATSLATLGVPHRPPDQPKPPR